MFASHARSHCVYYYPSIARQYSKARFLRINSKNPYYLIILHHIFQVVYPKMIITAIKLDLNWLRWHNGIKFNLFCAKTLPARYSPTKYDEPILRGHLEKFQVLYCSAQRVLDVGSRQIGFDV